MVYNFSMKKIKDCGKHQEKMEAIKKTYLIKINRLFRLVS